MKLALAALMLAEAPAGAQVVLERASAVAGPSLGGVEVPALGRLGAVPSGGMRTQDFSAATRGLAGEAKAWADKIKTVDKDLDRAYDAYRASLAQGDADKIAASRQERDYYVTVWRSITAPAKDMAADDPRAASLLQAFFSYLEPLPKREERLSKGKAASAKAVEAARDAAHAEAARLYEDDRKVVEELGFDGKSFEEVKAKVPAMRAESKEYMGWVRSAYDKTAAWARAVKVDSSWAEQYQWVYADYLENARLAKGLMDKKLGKSLR